MIGKRKELLLQIVLLIVLLLVASGSGLAADWYVDGSVVSSGDGTSWATAFKTISEGINAASAGDTTHVAAGTYQERLVINKQLTLTCAGWDSTIVQPVDIPMAGVYDVEIDASGTIIENFQFDFNGSDDTRSGNGIVVSDLNDPPVINVQIRNNKIYTGHANTGIQTGKNSDVSGLIVTGNIFYGDSDGMGEGIYVNPYNGSGKVTIQGNEFYGYLYSGISIEASNIDAVDNIVNSDVTKGVYGIRFIELTGGVSFSNVLISDNNIQNVQNGISAGTGTEVGSILTATIQSNRLSNNDVGLLARYGANLTITNNNISGNTLYGINNITLLPVVAENNWWGDASGPYHPVTNPTGTGNAVTDNVDYDPWITSAQADFTANPTSGIRPLTVTFTDTSIGPADTWSWDFNNDAIVDSAEQNPTYVYSTAGTYTVSLTINSPAGSDTETKIDYITVTEPPPVADFSGTPTTGIKPLTVQFSDSSTSYVGGIAIWLWDFGDGVGTSTEQNPSYIYQNAGTYTVSLTVTDSAGSDTETKTSYIIVNEQPPVADFSGTPTSGANPLLVQFTDTSTGVINSWSWDFGDGVGTSTLQNPSYNYSAAGTFTVTLTVSGPGGTDQEIKSSYISVYDPPDANFSANPTSGIKPLTVQFTDTSTGVMTTWSWNFGDGGTSTSRNPSHLYINAGSYTVTLTVTGPGGTDQEIKAGYITVNELPPIANFSADRTIGVKPLTVMFTDISTNPITSWLWDFGDGGTSTLQNPYHTYISAGIYTVTLTVTGPGGSDIEQKVDYIGVTDITVDHSTGNVDFPRITADGNGNVYAVWEDTRNGSTDIYFNYSTDYGFTWQETDIRLDKDTPGTSHSRRPQIACDNTGHVYAVWEDERNGGTDIYFNYSSNYGVAWQSSDKKLNSVPYALIPQYPKIACDNSGHVYVAWDDNYFNTCTIDINGVANCLSEAIRISTTGGVETQLTCDQNGHVYVAWRTSDIVFNYSSDFGNNWQSNITISDADPIHAIPYGLSLNSDESGNVYFAWDDGRNSTDSPDVYFNSCSNYGSICRASSDKKLNTGTAGSIWPVIDSDESGRIYAAWYDRRNSIGDIYLNYSSDYGSNWQVSDIRLDTDSSSADSGYPEVASDNNGNIYVIWTNDQEGIGPGLYTNYSPDYGVTWLSANRKIGSGGLNPQMVTDGSRFYIVSDNGDIVFNEMAPTEVPPFLPADPSPENGATQISLTPFLTWRGGDANLDDTLTYDIYFGSSLPLPTEPVSSQTETAYAIVTPLNYFTTYYWQVVAKDSTGAPAAGPIWSFTTMSGPPQFVNFSPPAGATGVGRTPTLSWTAIDPDPGDTLIYAVYFGTTNPPPLQSALYTSNTYNPGLLSHYTVYYWKIVAKDNHGTWTEGPILSFTTINNPPQFYTYSPADGATGIQLDDPYHANLKWHASDPDGGDTIRYDVYFGTSSPPPLVASDQTGASYYTGPLTHMTVYYWKVVARDNHGAEAELPVLSFTTLDNAPEFQNYSPVYMSTGVDPSPTLQWIVYDRDPDDTLTYDVYFGTSSSPPLVRSNQTAASYKPGKLSYSTRYYWKVVARDPHGAETTLDVLYFTTAASDYPALSDFSPADQASGVELSPTLSWSGTDPNPDDTLTYDVYFGYYSPPPKVVSNQTATTYQPGNLAAFTIYYWKIVARDNHNVEKAGPILSFYTLNRPPVFQSFTPVDLSTGIPLTVALKWSASDPDFYDTLTYDVYFGTSSQPPLVAVNRTTTAYKVKALSPLTTYYWQIIASDSHGAEAIGPVLSFITGNPPHIENISPNPCQTLQIITIIGERFGDTQGTSIIRLGDIVFRSSSVRIKMWSDTRIDFQVPAFPAWPSGTTRNRNLWVRVNGMVSNKVLLTITKP